MNNNDPLHQTQTWYDRTVLSNSKGEKVDLCLCSRKDFEEVQKESGENRPFTWETSHFPGPESLIYHNTKFVLDPTIKDGEPIFYKKIER